MAFNGRELTLDWDSTTLVGVKSKSMSMQNELVDVTNDDDDGWTTFLPNPGKKGVSWSVSGVTNDEVLINAYYNGIAEGAQINLPSALAVPGNIAGTGILQSLELSGEHDGSYDFSAEIVSSGAVTYTASAAS